MTSSTEPAPEPHSPRRRLLWFPLALLAAGWLLVVPMMGLQASLLMSSLFRPPYPAELAEAQHLLALAVGASLVAVVVGFALSVLVRSNGAGWFFALLLLPTLVLSLLWLGSWQSQQPHPAPSPRTPAACQEYSGGDTRCPGG